MISTDSIAGLFNRPVHISNNMIEFEGMTSNLEHNQDQTKAIFEDKWSAADNYAKIDELYKFQFEWFLSLYGFASEHDFKNYLSNKNVIVDTGCGLGYKAGWYARLAPHATVIGIDISSAVLIAAENYKVYPNLFFYQGDISDTGIRENTVNFTVCDQVIMHTEVPEKTFQHLTSITKQGGEFACYVYSKKALPRELIDDHFRKATHHISSEQMWEFAWQLTELGKRLSDLKITFESPDIPLLGIKGGKYDIQRFIYWNFLKCFWKEEWGFDLSKSTNFDWYAPSNAKRFSKEEFMEMAENNNLAVSFMHEEEACYSARFLKK